MNLCSQSFYREGFCDVDSIPTIAGVFRPVAMGRARFYDLALVIGGSLLIGIAAQVTIPLPLVPVTGQTFTVLLLGASLGVRLGVWTVLVYIMEGVLGLPVFSQGRSGLATLFGPTGGYLVGFLAAIAVAGLLAQRGWDRRVHTTIAAMILGNAVLYGFGLGWLTFLMGMDNAFAIGLYPFIVGDLIKAVIAAMVLPLGWRFLRRRKYQP
jgi:biotin transport system substrate-specific component